MNRLEARASIDDLNRHLTRLGVYANEHANPDGSVGLDYVSRRGRRPLATVDRSRGGALKWLASVPAAVASLIAGHAVSFATFQGG